MWAICHALCREIGMYRSTFAAFHSSTHLCMHTEAQLIHALTQNVPASIFRARSFVCTRRTKHD